MQKVRDKKKKKDKGPPSINVRFATPFSVRCLRCGLFIPKHKKFNVRGEQIQDESYLGIKLWRFYYRCPECLQEFTIKTDPKTETYVCERGVKRNFEQWHAERDGVPEDLHPKEEEEETGTNPMEGLEERAAEQQRQMERDDVVELLQALSARRARLSQDEILARLARRDGPEDAEQAKGAKEEEEAEIEDELLQVLEEQRRRKQERKGQGVGEEEGRKEHELVVPPSAPPSAPPPAPSLLARAAEAGARTATAASNGGVRLRPIVRVKRKREDDDGGGGGGGGVGERPAKQQAAPRPEPAAAMAALGDYGESEEEEDEGE